MTEILMAPHAIAASTPAAGHSEAARDRYPSGTEAEPATPISFAVLLKSCNHRAPADCGKKMPPAADALSVAADPAMTPAATLTTDSSALLSQLELEPTVAPNADSAAISGTTSPASLNAADAPIPTTLFSSSWPSIDRASQADFLSPAPAARALAIASAISPAPTLANADAHDGGNNRDTQRSGLFAGTAIERKAAPDKFAADAAITAESGKAGTQSAVPGEPGVDFRTAMERLTNHPATVAMQTIGTTSATVQPPSVRVETPLGQPGWGQEMGEKLTWMVSNNRQQADLVLNPPQLGRIEVTLIVEGDKLSATFASPNAAVRETLENSMARLREVLADAGITLGDTHVGAESRQDAKSSNTRNAQHPFGDAGRDSPLIPIDTIAGGPAWRSASGRGMVDVFA